MCRLSRTVRSALKPPGDVHQGCDATDQPDPPLVGDQRAGDQLQQGALALTVGTDDAHRLTLRDLERDVTQRPELAAASSLL